MDANWFYRALERAGSSQADLARHLRLAPSAVSRLLKGERQMKPLEAVQIAGFLEVSPEEVLRHAIEDTAAGPRSAPARRGRPPRAAAALEPTAAHSDRREVAVHPAGVSTAALIPIRSAGRGGGEQEMFLGDGPIGYTRRPANLDGVRAAYAIYMVGDSMEPRYEQGWLLHVNPFKPPTRGRDVVVYKAGQSVLIKQFVGWEGGSLLLRQLNPPEMLRVRRDEVLECHLIVGVDQEG